MNKIRIYVDMDDVLCNFSKASREAKEKNPEIEFPQSQPGFFESLEPIEGAIEGFNYLWNNDLYDVHILTAPSIWNPLNYTEKRLWVEKHLGFDVCYNLTLSPHKNLLIGDYLIDDIAEGKGQDGFTGRLLQFGVGDFEDWDDVLDHFKETYETKTIEDLT